MLRRTATARILFFTSGSGSATRLRAQPSEPTTTSYGSDEPVPVFLPWSARPWEVTHNYHQSQWKFLDTVFSHLATVTPASLNERALVQNARDVLSDIDDPIVALRRQQSRQARQRKRQEKMAAADAAAASAKSDADGKSRKEEDDEKGCSTFTTATQEPSAAASSAARDGDSREEETPVSKRKMISDNVSLAFSVHSGEAPASVLGDAASSGAKPGKAKKGAKKRKSSKKTVETIHYL